VRAPAIGGSVVDAATGKPIASAAVQIRSTSRDLDDAPRLWRIAGTVGLLATVPSGADGRFTFATSARENLTFDVTAPGYAPARVANLPRDGAADVALKLEPGGFTVAGTVRGALDGAPFPTTAYLMDEAGPRVFRAPVAADGTFAFRGIPSGTFRAYADRDDRPLFSGLLGDAAHAACDHLHAEGRGIEVTVGADVDGVALELGEKTPFPGFTG
jgi:hypothetical protein